MNNKQQITLVSFLAYFVMSGMLAPMVIISGAMSEHFGQPVTEITARFGWLTFGILVGAIIALLIFDLVRLRKLLMLVYTVLTACLVSLAFFGNMTLIGIALGLVGVCCGIGLAGAALVISRTYKPSNGHRCWSSRMAGSALPASRAHGLPFSWLRETTTGRACINLSH